MPRYTFENTIHRGSVITIYSIEANSLEEAKNKFFKDDDDVLLIDEKTYDGPDGYCNIFDENKKLLSSM